MIALAIAAVCGVAVEAGLGMPSTSLGSGGNGAAHLLKMVIYFLVFGGLPWSCGGHSIAIQACIGGAVLASIGRVDELLQPIVPTRYTPFAVILQIGAALSASRGIETLWLHRSAVALGATFFVVALLLLSIAPGVRGIRRTANRIRSDSALFDRTGRQPDIVIYPRPETATIVRAELARRGLPH